MGFNFPSSPTLNQVYPPTPVAGMPNYRWDGKKWKSVAKPTGAQASTATPLTDAISQPGIASTWSHADHVHGSDPTRALTASPNFTGTFNAPTFNTTANFNLTGVINAVAKRHAFGWASGQTWDQPLLKSDANIVLYDYDGLENWCGMGTDPNGVFWIRTGGSTRVSAAMVAGPSGGVGFAGTVWSSSPANGSNDTQWATTAFVQANQPQGGPYLQMTGGTITGTLTVSYGHIMPYRNGATGVLYFGSGATDRYLYYDGGNYYFNGSLLNTAAGRIWGSGDFTRPVTGGRIAFVGDWACPSTTPLTEPAGASVVTGCSGNGSDLRFRQKHFYVEGTWYAANFV